MPKYPIPNRYPKMSEVRKNIPTWSEQVREHPSVFNHTERSNEIGRWMESDVEYHFSPFPTIIMRNPYSEDDDGVQSIYYQFSVVGENESWMHFGNPIEFSNNPFSNPTIKTESHQGYNWNMIFPMFHVNWRIQLYKVDSNLNVQVYSDYQYDDTNKNVYIYMEPRSSKQQDVWIKSCLEYKEKTQCNLYIGNNRPDWKVSKHEDFTYVSSPSEVKDMYASYYIGYGEQTLFGYGMFGEYGSFNPTNKYLGEDRIGFNAFGTSLIHSAVNPRDPNVLSDKQIADDVLGLSDWDFINGC
tara:strand:- start:314 stop:1207 length:894 start_codon:yes stop_codon:yes gene_type:complete